MQIKDLRIGNFIKTFGGHLPYWQITHQDFAEMLYKHEIGDFEKIYDAIPLTEEWLLKFGFTLQLDKKHSVCNQYTIGQNPRIEDYLMIVSEIDKTFFYQNSFHSLKYVYQLQNLYFALTGQELITYNS